MKLYSMITLSILSISCITNVSSGQQHQSQYAGEEKRLIKSLSADDIHQLKNGKGWGLAKAAELNGIPGPIHLLQMKDKITLSKKQQERIQALYKDMKAKAIPLGKRLIKLEQELNNLFATKTMTKQGLSQQLEKIAKVRKKLRYVHLAAHLETPNILTVHQIEQYNRLRGYTRGNPCDKVPEDHNAEMWKKHNGCK